MGHKAQTACLVNGVDKLLLLQSGPITRSLHLNGKIAPSRRDAANDVRNAASMARNIPPLTIDAGVLVLVAGNSLPAEPI